MNMLIERGDTGPGLPCTTSLWGEVVKDHNSQVSHALHTLPNMWLLFWRIYIVILQWFGVFCAFIVISYCFFIIFSLSCDEPVFLNNFWSACLQEVRKWPLRYVAALCYSSAAVRVLKCVQQLWVHSTMHLAIPVHFKKVSEKKKVRTKKKIN